jgi:integrase
LASARLPAYVNKRKLASGLTGYYWVRPSWANPPAERHGRVCPVGTTNLGTDIADAIRKAEAQNDAFKLWRLGTDAGPAPGTVRWLFRWYRQQERFKKLRAEARGDYSRMMGFLEAFPMKTGTFGDRRVGAIDAAAADKLYAKLRPGGERQATYKMSTLRAIFGWAARHSATTGVKENPFAGMKLHTKAAKGNRPTSRAEYEAFKAQAVAMGRPSMALAATLAFECCQRSFDCFGFEDPDKRIERGINWEDYVPGERIGLIQSKTGNVVDIPLFDILDGERVYLYPELEAELVLAPRADGGIIVKDERTGDRYVRDYMQKLFRKIRDKAVLPKDMTFTGFRHGGLTEIGDSGADDVRSISGHSTLNVTAIYNKASQEKARKIASARRAHIAVLTAGEKEEA